MNIRTAKPTKCKSRREQPPGEYRTKRVIPEIYDAMQPAILTDQPYQTLLDPPRKGLPDWRPGQPKLATWLPAHPPTPPRNTE